jgi:hypothetical protein
METKKSRNFLRKKVMQTTFSMKKQNLLHYALKWIFRFFPKFFKRISENWTFINVLFYKTLPTFFWEFFSSMIELFIKYGYIFILLECRGGR